MEEYPNKTIDRLDPARVDEVLKRPRDHLDCERDYRRRIRRGSILLWLDSDAGFRWVVAPLTTVLFLIIAALMLAIIYVHTAHAADPNWRCNDELCVDIASIKSDGAGKMVAFLMGVDGKEMVWVALDCVARVAAVPDFETSIHPTSSLAWVCDRYGVGS